MDLALKGEQINLQRLNEIPLQLDDLLLPYTFDLTLYKQISNKELLEHIDRVGIVFYRKGKDSLAHE